MFIRQCLRSVVLISSMFMLVTSMNAANKSTRQSRIRPNIVYILCDDLGTGDIQCLSEGKGKIATPNIDRLARDGMIFSDAHSGSAVCTPTRYGILTGRYAWRTHLQKGVLWGNSEPLISKGRETVASLLQRAGYHTACIGKWHLGLGWVGTVNDDPMLKGCDVDYSKQLTDSPLSHGFDYFYGISASLDMPPYTWIHNNRVVELPTTIKAFHRKGPAAPSFEAVDVLPAITAKAIEYFEKRASSVKRDDQPFFLYLPYASPHTPIVPADQWKGRSALNSYADFVMQNDQCVGQLVNSLRELKLLENTLIIFTSDNGCSPAAQVGELVKKGHYPSAKYRGYKADIWEGGHRVPFICHWPARIKAGTINRQLISLTDLTATCAELSGQRVAADAAEDSVSFASALFGTTLDKAQCREAAVHHSISGRFAIRRGDWKLILCPGSGGWSSPKDAAARKKGMPDVQLYNLKEDISETKNLQAQHPEIVTELVRVLKGYIERGRSTPGPVLRNDVKVDIFKN